MNVVTLLTKILAILALVAPFTHPNFSKNEDIEQILYQAALASKNTGDFADIKLSNGHTYTIIFDDNHLNGTKEAPGSLFRTSIDEVVKSSPEITNTFENFQKLRRFYARLIDDFKVDEGEFAEIGVAFDSAFITDKTPAELRAILEGEAAAFKALKHSEDPVERLRYETAERLIKLHRGGIIKKIYEQNKAEQSYVIQGFGSFPTYFTLIDLGKK